MNNSIKWLNNNPSVPFSFYRVFLYSYVCVAGVGNGEYLPVFDQAKAWMRLYSLSG